MRDFCQHSHRSVSVIEINSLGERIMMDFCGFSQGMLSEFAWISEIPYTMHPLKKSPILLGEQFCICNWTELLSDKMSVCNNFGYYGMFRARKWHINFEHINFLKVGTTPPVNQREKFIFPVFRGEHINFLARLTLGQPAVCPARPSGTLTRAKRSCLCAFFSTVCAS